MFFVPSPIDFEMYSFPNTLDFLHLSHDTVAHWRFIAICLSESSYGTTCSTSSTFLFRRFPSYVIFVFPDTAAVIIRESFRTGSACTTRKRTPANEKSNPAETNLAQPQEKQCIWGGAV